MLLKLTCYPDVSHDVYVRHDIIVCMRPLAPSTTATGDGPPIVHGERLAIDLEGGNTLIVSEKAADVADMVERARLGS